jgi:putative transposase
MPRKPKAAPAAVAVKPPIAGELLDQLVKGPMTQDALEVVMRGFKKSLVERALASEMSHHLGYRADEVKPISSTNYRNGKTGKTVLTGEVSTRIEVPRDRQGLCEPQLIGKHERRFTSFDDKIIAMYACAMTVREIQEFLNEMYAVEVSPDLISCVTEAVMTQIVSWQTRALEQMYPVVLFDARQNQARWGCAQQGRLPRLRHAARWQQGHSGHLD